MNYGRRMRPAADQGRVWSLAAVAIAVAVLATACSGTKPSALGPTTTAPPTTSTTKPSPTTTTTPRAPGWSAPQNVGHGSALEAIGCATLDVCVALGGQGQGYRYSSGRWYGAVTTDAASGATGQPSVSCVSPAFCMALWRGTEDAAVWDGTSWSAPMTLSGSEALQAVGCATMTFCVAVDGFGTALYYDGSGWSATPNDWGSVNSISCTNPSFCVSVRGGVSIWNGSEWTRPQVYGTTSSLNSVSCPTVTFCAAVDSTGQAIEYNGSTWAGPQNLESVSSSLFGGPSLTGVSCTSASFCIAVDTTGKAFTWNGTAWSAGVEADPGHAFTAISCSAQTVCTATDKQGYALTHT